MSEDKGGKCELCESQPATILCSECPKCYCEKCSNFMHNLPNKKGHKVETIAKGIIVNAWCPLHKNNALELFCVGEVKLCCGTCKDEEFHKDHKLADISEIQNDNEIFSAQNVRELFEDSLGNVVGLEKKN